MTNLPSNEPIQAKRECAYCGVNLRYEGGIRAWGALYCDDECADAHEAEQARGTYAEHPLGGAW